MEADPAWIPYDQDTMLDDPRFHCTIHDMDAAMCPCAPIEEWGKAGLDPYRERPRNAFQFQRVAMADWVGP